MGTSVGTQVFIQYGWRPAASLSLAWCAFCVFIMLVRGPNVGRYTWFGWEGGAEIRKNRLEERYAGKDVESGGAGVGEKEKAGEKEAVEVVERRDSCTKEGSAVGEDEKRLSGVTVEDRERDSKVDDLSRTA